MRLLAISIVILAGVLAAGVGVFCNSMPETRQYNSLTVSGHILATFGLVLFAVEWWSPAERSAK